MNEYSLWINLTIKSLALADYGTYVCASVNALGKMESQVSLHSKWPISLYDLVRCRWQNLVHALLVTMLDGNACTIIMRYKFCVMRCSRSLLRSLKTTFVLCRQTLKIDSVNNTVSIEFRKESLKIIIKTLF